MFEFKISMGIRTIGLIYYKLGTKDLTNFDFLQLLRPGRYLFSLVLISLNQSQEDILSSGIIIAQVPIYTFQVETVNYYVSGGNGIQIYVEEKGDPEKTTILFTSGYMSSRLAWNPLWYDTEFSEKFHLVRWDYRGAGRSDKPRDAKAYSLELNAQDLQAVITKIKKDKPNKKIITVGWSFGTPTTTTFMINNPDIKIDGFISVGGMIFLNFTEPNLNNDEILKYSIASVDPDYKFSTIVYGLNGYSNYRTFKPVSDQYRAFKLGESVLIPPEYRKFDAKSFDYRDFFSSLNIPTLNLIGEKDKLVTLEHSLQFASLAKNGKKIVYKDIGHSPPWEDTKSDCYPLFIIKNLVIMY
ncbi:alpha/beta hydrolase [Rhizophagus clarus]|uniref:Alpha/beta hydrolase n=1 Tax=Rhizophagus clarus TaxID=94130 RepID=A0A8H3M136_9GLOM|nr:alpha/beta hydrolase [Rhizophagus clarus]